MQHHTQHAHAHPLPHAHQHPHLPYTSSSSSLPFASASSSTSSLFHPSTHHDTSSFFEGGGYPYSSLDSYNFDLERTNSNLEAHSHHDYPERGRTGPAHHLGSISALERMQSHPYSRSPSRNAASVSRDSSAHTRNESTGYGPGGRSASAGGGAPGTPPRSGRAGVKRRQKYSRTRTGCLCCRSRRIKCDEERPVCRRCTIAKKQCVYPDEGGASVSRQSSREDKDRALRSRSGTGESPEEGNGNKEEAVNSRTQIPPPPSTFLDPFNLALPAYYKPDGVADSSDFSWDQSLVSAYTDPASVAGMPELVSAGTMVTGNPDSVQEGTETVAGLQAKYAGGAPMLATPNFLLPWFPTQEERSLILHYCANAADLMMAIPSGLNPMLAINLPLALDSPRGANPSADALRVALLGIGAIHQAFLLARSGVSTTQTTAMFQYASNLRDMGKELVRRAVAEPSGARSDAALGAATALGTIDIFFGGEGWTENFNLAKEMVAYRGGPAAMLKASTPKQLAEGVTISPARLMLEILAIYDVFGCLTTGEEPALLSEKYENWWFEGSQSTYEEHSVEKQFGMSRVMVHLFSRLTGLISRVAQSDVAITETSSSSNVTLAPTQTEASAPSTPTSAWLSSLMKSANVSGATAVDPLVIEARKLNSDVDAWIESLQLSTLEHERVQVGNRAYAHAMKILLLRRVFKYPREHSRVQQAANEVLRHCSTSTAILGMSIDLMWPAIIAGCCVEGEARKWLLTLLEGFKSQCCFDVETATRIIQEAWRRVDAKEAKDDWKEVCDDFGLKVLLC